MERMLVKAQMNVKLLEVGLVELSKGEYALTTFMHATKDIFGNWTKCQMHGDYRLVDK
jgi:hypothetical protein